MSDSTQQNSIEKRKSSAGLLEEQTRLLAELHELNQRQQNLLQRIAVLSEAEAEWKKHVGEQLFPENRKPERFLGVKVADFDVPFGSLVGFLVKLTLASIPAMIIVWVILGTLIAGLLSFSGLLQGFAG